MRYVTLYTVYSFREYQEEARGLLIKYAYTDLRNIKAKADEDISILYPLIDLQ